MVLTQSAHDTPVFYHSLVTLLCLEGSLLHQVVGRIFGVQYRDCN
jgi:hypothetical protein